MRDRVRAVLPLLHRVPLSEDLIEQAAWAFERSYGASIVDEVKDPDDVLYFPRQFQETRGQPQALRTAVLGPEPMIAAEEVPPERGLAVEVVPSRRRRWVGLFSRGVTGHDSFMTGVLGWPDPRHVCVINEGTGYVVDVESPEDWEASRDLLDLHPIRCLIAVPAYELVVFGDFTGLSAYGAAGLRWKTKRLGWDDLEIHRLEGDEIVGGVWEAPTDTMREFRVDVRTGEHSGGADLDAFAG